MTELYFESCGPSNAPTIVFLHGGGAAGWMWQPVIDRLESRYHCLALDLPEQGRSKAGPFSIENASRLVAELIHEQAHGSRAHLVGLSEGAQVGVALLATAPGTMESAFISSALLHPLPGAGLLTPGLVAAAFRWSVTPFKNSDAWIRLNMKYSAGIPESFFPQFRQEFKNLTESGFTNLMVANQRFRMPLGLAQADLPVLAVAGKKEYASMRRSARDLAGALPQGCARLLNLPRTSLAQQHNWAMHAPDLFAAAVEAWIEGRDLPEALEEFPN